MIQSRIFKEVDFDEPWFQQWVSAMKQPNLRHRKQWEHAIILEALLERKCFGKKGLSFGTGKEPLVALLAHYNSIITATDLAPDTEVAKIWAGGNQYMESKEVLNLAGICEPDKFERNVTIEIADMNSIPEHLRDFDFNWSSCSFEHVGSIDLGMKFIVNQMDTLKPGGWAIHTTEYNLSSNDTTVDNEGTVVFRKKDIEEMIRRLEALGHYVEPMNWDIGFYKPGYIRDNTPFGCYHQGRGFETTSILLVIQKA